MSFLSCIMRPLPSVSIPTRMLKYSLPRRADTSTTSAANRFVQSSRSATSSFVVTKEPPDDRTKRNRHVSTQLPQNLDCCRCGNGRLSGLPLARGAHAAGSDVIRIGMIGCGSRCSGAAVNAMNADPGVRLVAMTDIFADRARNRREILRTERPKQVVVDDAHCFSGLDGYKHVIESVDVVLIACSAKYHPVYLQAAIEAGKHVFVEKPHAIDPVGVRQLAAACELAKQKKLSVMSGTAEPIPSGISGDRQTNSRRRHRRHRGHPGNVAPRPLSSLSNAIRN